MAAKKRGAMHESVEFYLSEILDGQREFRGDIKDLAKAVAEDAGDIGSLRRDVDGLIEAVGTDGKNGLIEEMRSLRNTLDNQLRTKVVDTRHEVDWDKIGKIIVGFMAAAGYWFGVN